MNQNIGKANAQLVLDRYHVPDDPILNQEHFIKKFSGGNGSKKPVSMLIGTDGAAKGAPQAPDRKSFAGWGFYALMTYSSGRSSVATFSGCMNQDKQSIEAGKKNGSYMFNDNSLTAELVAIRQALKFVKHPTALKIVTDCKHAIEIVKDPRSAETKLRELEGIPGSQLSQEQRVHMYSLQKNIPIAHEISELIGDETIVSFSMQWVASHTLDGLTPDEIPRIEDGKTLEDQILLAHILVNSAADGLANEGVRTAIESSIKGLSRLKPPPAKTGKAESQEEKKARLEFDNKTKIASKNFHFSGKTRRYAEDFLASKPPGFVPRETIEAVLGEKSLKNIDRLRNQLVDEMGSRFKGSIATKNQEEVQLERDLLTRSHEHLSAFAKVEARELGRRKDKELSRPLNHANTGKVRADGKVRYDNPNYSRRKTISLPRTGRPVTSGEPGPA